MKSFTFVANLAILAMLSGCNKDLDRANLESFTGAIVRAVDNQDTTLLQNLHTDSLKRVNPNQRTGYLKFNTKEFTGKEIEFIRFDTAVFKTSVVTSRELNIYCKSDTTYYHLAALYRRNERNMLSLDAITIYNLNQQCADYQKEPYQGRHGDIAFKSFDFTFDPWKGMFTKCSVEAHNDTGFDLNYIRFRLILYANKVEVFNRTIESPSKFFKGDVIHIEVPALQGFRPHISIANDNITWEAGVIEMLPKPVSEDCITLKELQSL
jgi:hypothetical protein